MFWTRGSGKRLRGCVDAQIVALYLMTSPHTTMVGIFNLSLPTLCHETGLDREAALKGLARCSEERFAFWDEEEEIVFVPALAHHQLGESLKKTDHKVKGVERALAPYKGHRFYDLFLDRYSDLYGLTEGASKSLPRDDVPDPVPDPGSDRGERERGSAPAAPPAHDPCMNPEETAIPLDLREKATATGGAIDQLMAHLKLPKAVLLDYLDRKYLPYWTIGKGMGERRSYWLKHLRQQILEAADRGHLKAAGLIQHEAAMPAHKPRQRVLRPKSVPEALDPTETLAALDVARKAMGG